MVSSFIDIIFMSLIGVAIILAGIGGAYSHNWWILRSFGNKKDEESFNATHWYIWKKSAFYITLSIFSVILVSIIHLIFRR